MAANWEYKVITLKHGGGGLKFTITPDDDEAMAALNREGANGWELVSAVCAYPGQPVMFYLKRQR
jgi:hypothetical protein